MKTGKNYYIAGILLITAVLGVTAAVYPQLPSVVPMHWDAHGNVNGWGAKWTLFLIDPAIMGGILLLFTVLPWLSPRHFEMDSFRSTYLYVMVVILSLLAYVHMLLLAAGLSLGLNMNRAIMGGVSLLIALVGNVLGKVRRNFYMGVRTPWTIANEQVWNATHRLAAKTFFAGGILGLLCALVGAPFWVLVGLIAAAALIPVLYSLFYYKHLERNGKLNGQETAL
ncbi:MAG TPA: SdpI family protein [Candidatus Sulfotelmatobacter sp.]|nr:SdpI family protein [Candidatus Sulfotelmatobacter sp.]